MKQAMKWEPAVLVRKPDNLIASTQFKNVKAFIPAYEKDRHINMNYLMGWEYGRLWMAQKSKWEKMMYTATDKNTTGALAYQRKFVLRKKNKK